MKRAIISDIHGNLEALLAVFEDLDRQRVDAVYCLGGVVGYGPNPCECLELVRERSRLVLLGKEEQAVLFDPDGFSSWAERAIRWTRMQVECHDRLPSRGSLPLIDFLSALPRTHTEGDLMFVHGSARRPLDEYVFPEDIFDALKISRIFDLVGRYCFQGNTHIPGVFTTAPDFIAVSVPKGDGAEAIIELPPQKAMVNVGSVGQPRDGDNRACYVILEDDRRVRFRRVGYPFAITSRKIHDIAELDDFLGDRLEKGR